MPAHTGVVEAAIDDLNKIFEDLQGRFHDEWDWMRACFCVEVLKCTIEDLQLAQNGGLLGQQCACGGTYAEEIRKQEFQYGAVAPVTLTAVVPVIFCTTCKDALTDYRGEIIRQVAVDAHLAGLGRGERW